MISRYLEISQITFSFADTAVSNLQFVVSERHQLAVAGAFIILAPIQSWCHPEIFLDSGRFVNPYPEWAAALGWTDQTIVGQDSVQKSAPALSSATDLKIGNLDSLMCSAVNVCHAHSFLGIWRTQFCQNQKTVRWRSSNLSQIALSTFDYVVYDIITYISPPGMRLECTASIGQVYWHTTTETCQVVIMMTLKMIMVVVILLNIDDDNGHDDDDSNGHGYVICLWWRWQDVANRCQQSQRSMRAGSQEELLRPTLIGKTESAFHNIGKLP